MKTCPTENLRKKSYIQRRKKLRIFKDFIKISKIASSLLISGRKREKSQMGHLQNVHILASIDPGGWKEPEAHTFEVVHGPKEVQDPFILLRYHWEPSKFSCFQRRFTYPGPQDGLQNATWRHCYTSKVEKGTYPLHLVPQGSFLLI